MDSSHRICQLEDLKLTAGRPEDDCGCMGSFDIRLTFHNIKQSRLLWK